MAVLSREITQRWIHLTLLMIHQQWFRQWLGAFTNQQTTTWANVDQDPQSHMASLDHNELILQSTEHAAD